MEKFFPIQGKNPLAVQASQKNNAMKVSADESVCTFMAFF